MPEGTVTHPYWITSENRMYIEINDKVMKVPFKYGRVTCKVGGLVPVQSMKEGEKVQFTSKEYDVLTSICSKS